MSNHILAKKLGRAGAYIWYLIIWSRLLRLLTLHSTTYHTQRTAKHIARKQVQQLSPTLHVSSPDHQFDHFASGFSQVYAILVRNLQNPDNLSPHRYARPGPAFRGIYLWDSAFIAHIWQWWDPAVSADILRSVIVQQDPHTGRLPHVTSDLTRSKLTQPPLISWAAAELTQYLPPAQARQFAHEVYQPLAHYHQWLMQERQIPGHPGLFAWQHPYESGIDNSPRFGDRHERHQINTTHIAAPDFATYMALHCESLMTLAKLAGSEHYISDYRAQLTLIRSATNKQLWHRTDALYYDQHINTHDWQRIATIASLLPLWAGIPTSKQAKELTAHTIDPRYFGTPIPFPSVALNDPTFEPDMWRGPVWINTAYSVLVGLRRYGKLREAAQLAWQLCDGVYSVLATEGYLYEFYDPRYHHHTKALTRKRGHLWKRLVLGSGPQRHFAGWSGLVNNIVIEMLFGLHRRRGVWYIQPIFPTEAVGCSFTLELPAQNLHIYLIVQADQSVHGYSKWPSSDQKNTFTLTFGEIKKL